MATGGKKTVGQGTPRDASQGREQDAQERGGKQGDEASPRPQDEHGKADSTGHRDGEAGAQADESDIEKKAPTDLPGAMGGGLMGG